MKERAVCHMTKYLSILLIPALLLLMGCGGGGNETKETVFISASIDDGGDFIEAEMLKDVSTDTAVVTVSVGSVFDNVDVSIGTVRLNRWELTYARQDGGTPNLAPISGEMDQTISVNGTNTTGVPQTSTFEIEVFRTFDKIFSDFGQSFDPTQSVTFDCSLKIIGVNLAGDTVTDTIGFRVQAAVFLPVDSLAPSISNFSEVSSINLGNDYFASWVVLNRVDFGIFLLPFGGQFFLDGISDFPVGSLSVNTGFLEDSIAPGASQAFPGGMVIASNPFGTSQSNQSTITVTAPEETPVEPLPAVEIVEFVSDRSSVLEGGVVTLSWSTIGGADTIEILPDTYNGVKLDLAGKNPAFDSVQIQPDFSLTPILRVSRSVDGASATTLLDSEITVTPIPTTPPDPPAITFFQASNTNPRIGQSVGLYWNVTGGVERVELFPINGERVDVTDVTSFMTPLLLDERTYSFTLVVFGTDGSIANQSVSVTTLVINNQAIQIQNLDQQPGTEINNGDSASFSFTVSDPERKNSSWRVDKIAGDSASYAPLSGKITNGLGDVSIAVRDYDDANNGFLTFEVSAYDDPVFGGSIGSTRAVRLVNFETNGQLSDTAPVINDAVFVEGGPDAAPGTQGVIDFNFADPDTLNLRWSVSIISGDRGGVLSPSSGSVSTGAGQISVQYTDDPDTPLDPVVFLVRVEEDQVGQGNPQSDIFILRVVKGPADTTGGGTDPTQPIVFADDGLYDNLFGGVAPIGLVHNYTMFTNGNVLAPVLYKNSDLSGEMVGASMVVDLSHFSGDSSSIDNVSYSRNFGPAGTIENAGSFTFDAYYDSAGSTAPGSNSPITDGVSRYYMPFGVEAFRDGNSGPYSLPTLGQTLIYQVTASADDSEGNSESLVRTLVVISPTP